MRVLLVEDDRALAQQVADFLRTEHFAIDIATNGEDGHHLGLTETYDAAILDLGLPKMDGAMVLRAWRTAGRTLPVLILTARDGWSEKVDGFKAGADDYLTKPFRVEEVVMRLMPPEFGQIIVPAPTYYLEEDAPSNKQPSGFLWIPWDGWVAFFTAVLAGVSIWQGRAIIRGERFTRAALRYSQRQARAAVRAAKAAEKTVEKMEETAAHQLRAYVFVHRTELELTKRLK
jgi:CheY-like chemotaxis protein